MSSPSSSSYVHSPRLFRKRVPEGSNDFQKVLGSILHDEERGSKVQGDICKENQSDLIHSLGNHEDDCENLADYNEDCEVGHILTDNISNSDIDFDNNNKFKGRFSNSVCHIRQCHRLDRNLASPNTFSDSVCPSEVKIYDRNGQLLGEEAVNSVKTNGSFGHLILPHINQSASVMGTTCSSSFYDKQEWHYVGASETNEDRARKGGKVTNRKSQSLFDSKKLSSKAEEKGFLTQSCTCAQNNSENSHRSDNSDDSGRSTPQSLSTSDSRTTSRTPSPQSDSRKDRNGSGKKTSSLATAAHSKLSRISKRSTSSKLDVSPHRLLVRRSYSPQSRINSVDGQSRRNRMNSEAHRQRSQSWSESKASSNPPFKSSSPPTVRIQSPDISPEANHSPLIDSSSNKLTSSASSKKSHSVVLLPDQKDSLTIHELGCPLFSDVDMDRLRVNVDYLDDGDDITPISRRRAVSESHTSRSRQRPSRRPDSVDQSTHGHPHVHWADEERGSALSTSVFLSSIRPRSYSHGAMGNRPNRPILKKVTGF